VLVSIPELLRVLEYVRSTFDAESISALQARVQRYVDLLEGRSFNELVDDSVPCPLLIDGRCSVYALRPLVCRGYNSTDVDACREAHRDSTVLVPTFSVLKDVTDGATVGVAQGLEDLGCNPALVDLGTALHLALDAGDGFSQAILDGGTALRTAENASWVADLWARVSETARQVGIRP
jgi:hypothetical protein